MQRSARDWDAARRRMVDEQLRARDISSPRVLEAMLAVPRHLFVPESLRDEAYRDSPLPIGHDQTISQPYIVAFMTQALDVQPEHRVLEVGTGSGYQAAVLAALAKEVYTIEIVAPLAEQARERLPALGYRNVRGTDRQRLPRMARARALRQSDGDGRARPRAGRPAETAEDRRADGDSSWNGDPGTPHLAPHRHRHRDAQYSSSALRADDEQAQGIVRR